MIDYSSLLPIVPIMIFLATSSFYLFLYMKTSMLLKKKRLPRYSTLNQLAVERLRNILRGREDMKNLQEIIYNLKMLRREVEEIVNEYRRSKES